MYYSQHGAIRFESAREENDSTLLEPQSRFGDKPVKFQVVCPQNGTAVLKGLSLLAIKMKGTNRGEQGGGRACYVTPDMSYGY